MALWVTDLLRYTEDMGSIPGTGRYLDFHQVLLSKVLYEDCMTFVSECGDGTLYFSRQKLFLLIKWVHNDLMYVRFAGMRNTKTWSKSSRYLVALIITY